MSQTPKRDLMEIFTRRAVLVTGAGVVGLGAIGAKLAWLQAQDLFSDQYTEALNSNRFNLVVVPAPRGILYDRFGEALAVTSRDYRVKIVPEQAGEDVADIIRKVGEIVGMDPDMIARRVRDAKSGRAFDEVLIRQGLTWSQFAAINVRLPELPGVTVSAGELRYYPYKSAFAHPIGYVQKPSQNDIDSAVDKAPNYGAYLRNPEVRIGKTGLESNLEPLLQGTPGWRMVEVNARGRIVSEVGYEEKKPIPGAGVSLTIDADLQRQIMERVGGESAAVVVIDIVNGELLAMVSAPGFDPNDFVNGISSEKFKALNTDEYKPLFHKAVTGAYSPGSTFKLVTLMAALQAGMDPKTFRVTCPGYFWFGGRRFHCWRHRGHGVVDTHAALKLSCDVFFYQASLIAGQQRLADLSRQLGLGQKFDVNLPGVLEGVVPDAAWWRAKRKSSMPGGTVLNTGIGQGDLLVTPLQLAVATARLANGGKAIMPTLVRAGPGVAPPKPPLQLNLNPEHVARVLDAAFAVCNEPGGTAFSSGDLQVVRDADGRMLDAADAPPGLKKVQMAGKTGSAQVRVITMAERATGVKSNSSLPWRLRDNALFVAYAPYDAPRYACAVIVEHGGSGGHTAAPIGRDALRAVLLRDTAFRPTMKLAEDGKPGDRASPADPPAGNRA